MVNHNQPTTSQNTDHKGGINHGKFIHLTHRRFEALVARHSVPLLEHGSCAAALGGFGARNGG